MSKYFIFIVLTVVLNASSQLLLKAGISQIGKATYNIQEIVRIFAACVTNGYILLGLIAMTLSMFTHILSLSRFDVSFVFPFISFAYVIVAVAGLLFMNEAFNLMRFVGIAVILAGTVILAVSNSG
jgi:multidrug transporter EmrE-like cation transporter